MGMEGNMTKRDIFDASLGEQLRDQALAQVAASDPSWQETVLLLVRAVAREKPTLTTDDVWQALGGHDPSMEGRAMGAVMVTAAHQGVIVKTPMTLKSERAACHRRDLRVWKSLVYRSES